MKAHTIRSRHVCPRHRHDFLELVSQAKHRVADDCEAGQLQDLGALHVGNMGIAEATGMCTLTSDRCSGAF